jgi:hypothetical protein
MCYRMRACFDVGDQPVLVGFLAHVMRLALPILSACLLAGRANRRANESTVDEVSAWESDSLSFARIRSFTATSCSAACGQWIATKRSTRLRAVSKTFGDVAQLKEISIHSV